MPPTSNRPGAADLALVGAALCFGGTFLVVQDAIEDVEPILGVLQLEGSAARGTQGWRAVGVR